MSPCTNLRFFSLSGPVPGKFLGIVGQGPSLLYSFDIFRFCFYSFEVYFIDSFQMIGKFPEVLNLNRFFPDIGLDWPGSDTCTNPKTFNSEH